MITNETLTLLNRYDEYLNTYIINMRDIFWVFFVPFCLLMVFWFIKKSDNIRVVYISFYLLFILCMFCIVCLYQIKKQYLANEIERDILVYYEKLDNKDKVLSEFNNDELMKDYNNYLVVRNILNKKK